MTGSVSGVIVQAGAVHGDITITGRVGERSLVPRQLPPTTTYFSARTAELTALDALTGGESPGPVVLCGPGGVGKTTLAVRWASEAQARFPDGQLYLGLQGFNGTEPVDPSAALTASLRGLGVPAPEIPVNLAEQTAMYRSVTAGRQLLLLLDDAFSAAQVRPLLAGHPAVTLITSRRRLVSLVHDGAHILDVGPLDRSDAVELLVRAVGAERIARDPRSAEELAVLCGGMPIALCVAAGRLALRPRMSVRAMAAALVDEPTRLAELSVPETGSVASVFDATYRALTRPAALLYRRLSIHPGRDFGLDVITAVPVDTDGDDAGQDTDDLVTELIEANLLEETDEDRFRFHDLLRLDAKRRCQTDDTEADRERVLRAMLEFYLSAAHRADLAVTPYRRRLDYDYLSWSQVRLPQFTGRGAALDWFERELTNVVHAGRSALEHGLAELAWRLCDVLWPVFLYLKQYPIRLEVDARGAEAARRWGNRWAEADMLKRLSRVCTKFGRYAEAEEHIRTALDRYRQAGDERGVLDAEEGLATLYRETGRLALADDALVHLLAGYRRLGDPRTVGLTCINLGSLRIRLNRPVEALALLDEARSIFDSLADVDPYNRARVLITTAAAYLDTGDVAAAQHSAAEAVRRMGDLGSDHERAEALDVLGQVAWRQGDSGTARRHWTAAAEIFERLGLADRAREVRRVQ
ncbi:tetratricopeptide repeat protein [Solwaraspora sp. WMMB335]|uniref:tetratricopeptide repeat protein n=1 Tax=Solwaraspora sp. WMMB335 TaxID=3404118 RepID=UPI003B945CBC